MTVKGNVPLRLLGLMIFVMVALSHFFGQIDITEISFLWLLLLMATNAVQASYTGFCPMFKDKDGNCKACGVQCAPKDSTGKVASTDACCSGESGCKDEKCCTDDKCCSEKQDAEKRV